MHYTIYKTTNQINGKFYIGKHQTKNINDGYLGSGKLLKRAIAKYGIENFVTEILEDYDQEWKMNLAERIYVVIDREVSYNLCSGGKGGFGYINKNGLNWTPEKNKKINSIKMKNSSKEQIKLWQKKGTETTLKKYGVLFSGHRGHGRLAGFHLSEETKQKIRKHRQGKVSCYDSKGNRLIVDKLEFDQRSDLVGIKTHLKNLMLY